VFLRRTRTRWPVTFLIKAAWWDTDWEKKTDSNTGILESS
jgi:hypothetical protein